MNSKLFYMIFLLAVMIEPRESGFVLFKGMVHKIHSKIADGKRIFFVKGNCDSDKFYSIELKMCVKIFQM